MMSSVHASLVAVASALLLGGLGFSRPALTTTQAQGPPAEEEPVMVLSCPSPIPGGHSFDGTYKIRVHVVDDFYHDCSSIAAEDFAASLVETEIYSWFDCGGDVFDMCPDFEGQNVPCQKMMTFQPIEVICDVERQFVVNSLVDVWPLQNPKILRPDTGPWSGPYYVTEIVYEFSVIALAHCECYDI